MSARVGGKAARKSWNFRPRSSMLLWLAADFSPVWLLFPFGWSRNKQISHLSSGVCFNRLHTSFRAYLFSKNKVPNGFVRLVFASLDELQL